MSVHNKYQQTICKQESVRIRSVSVTPVTGSLDESPSMRYAQLRPWLELAKLLPPPKEQPDPGRPGVTVWIFSSESSEEFFRRFEASGLSNDRQFGSFTWRSDGEDRDRLQKLAQQIARNLIFLAGAAEHCHYFEDSEFLGPDAVYGLCIEPIDSAAASISIRQGRFDTRISDPYKGFLDALAGAEAGRLRRCPICEQIFYALRRTQWACSKSCNQTRRVRKWRENEEKRVHRVGKLLLEGKGPREIASTLETDSKKVRRYIAAAKKKSKG